MSKLSKKVKYPRIWTREEATESGNYDFGYRDSMGNVIPIFVKVDPKKEQKQKDSKLASVDKIQQAVDNAEYNKKNKYGTAGLGGLDSGIGDTISKIVERLFL